MPNPIDVLTTVGDAAGRVDDVIGGGKIQPIGFWRAAVAIVGAAVWVGFGGIILGLPAAISVMRWVHGESERPFVALVYGLATSVLALFCVAAIIAAMPVGFVSRLLTDGDPPAWLSTTTLVLAGCVALAAGWRLGRYLFRKNEPQPGAG